MARDTQTKEKTKADKGKKETAFKLKDGVEKSGEEYEMELKEYKEEHEEFLKKHRQQVEEMERSFRALENENFTLAQDKERYRARANDAFKENAKFVAQARNNASTITALRKLYKNLKAEKEDLLMELMGLEQEHGELKDYLSTAQADISGLENAHVEVEEEKARLHEDIENWRNAYARVKTARDTLETRYRSGQLTILEKKVIDLHVKSLGTEDGMHSNGQRVSKKRLHSEVDKAT